MFHHSDILSTVWYFQLSKFLGVQLSISNKTMLYKYKHTRGYCYHFYHLVCFKFQRLQFLRISKVHIFKQHWFHSPCEHA